MFNLESIIVHGLPLYSLSALHYIRFLRDGPILSLSFHVTMFPQKRLVLGAMTALAELPLELHVRHVNLDNSHAAKHFATHCTYFLGLCAQKYDPLYLRSHQYFMESCKAIGTAKEFFCKYATTALNMSKTFSCQVASPAREVTTTCRSCETISYAARALHQSIQVPAKSWSS